MISQECKSVCFMKDWSSVALRWWVAKGYKKDNLASSVKEVDLGMLHIATAHNRAVLRSDFLIRSRLARNVIHIGPYSNLEKADIFKMSPHSVFASASFSPSAWLVHSVLSQHAHA